MSQDRLATRMRSAGFRWTQSIATRTESGTRPVPITEAATLAALLQLDLNSLIPADVTAICAVCAVCKDNPPVGFTCNECGQRG